MTTGFQRNALQSRLNAASELPCVLLSSSQWDYKCNNQCYLSILWAVCLFYIPRITEQAHWEKKETDTCIFYALVLFQRPYFFFFISSCILNCTYLGESLFKYYIG